MDKLEEIYTNVKDPGGFGGVRSLYRAARSKGLKVSLNDVRDFLKHQDTYTLHKPAKRKFRRNRVIVYGIDEQWELDLADMRNIKRYNDGFCYILCCIDVFSKFAFAVVTKDKKAETMLKAIKSILASGRKASVINTDRGNEFLAKMIRSELSRRGIRFFVTYSEVKASIVERFNRTLKEKMYRYFTQNDTKRYIEVLPDLIDSYNNSYHKSIKCKPIDVCDENAKQIWYNLYGKVNFSPPVTFPFEIGDLVRISKNKQIFEKGYLPNYTEELFRVVQRIPREPPVYKLEALNGEDILGVFYAEEIQKIGKDLANCKFKIEKVLRKRKKPDGTKELLVRWKGYGPDFDSWVQEIDF